MNAFNTPLYTFVRHNWSHLTHMTILFLSFMQYCQAIDHASIIHRSSPSTNALISTYCCLCSLESFRLCTSNTSRYFLDFAFSLNLPNIDVTRRKEYFVLLGILDVDTMTLSSIQERNIKSYE